MAARVQGATLAATGYKELVRGLKEADPETRREVRKVLREVGDNVKFGAGFRFRHWDARSAAGYRTYVRQRGIAVEQSLRKTTGKHPEFGALQMRRALVPALNANEHDTELRMEQAIEKVCARVG